MTTYDQFDVDTLLLCIENEGDRYERLMRMGRAAANVHDGRWAEEARDYARRLRRERRYDGSLSAATVNAFAFALRDRYIAKADEFRRYELERPRA